MTAVSVLMPAYNSERFIRSSVRSILSQTFTDFELIVVDDHSTDATPRLLRAISDPRLRVIRTEQNLGVVGAINRAAREARGQYIARMDADDISMPTRLAKQKDFLDTNPDIALVGTGTFYLENGVVSSRRTFVPADHVVTHWMLHLRNPIPHPSMMFRSDLLGRLPDYLKEDFKFAEDFEFVHRVSKLGRVSVLPERLLIYRLHEVNITRVHREEMIQKAKRVLLEAHADLTGRDRPSDTELVARHIQARMPISDRQTLYAVGGLLAELATCFAEKYRLAEPQYASIRSSAWQIWWEVIRASIRSGHLRALADYGRALPLTNREPPPLGDMAASVLSGLVPRKQLLRSMRAETNTRAQKEKWPAELQICGVKFVPAPVAREEPPVLFVVVDAEADFDWTKPFARDLTCVNSIVAQEKAHPILEAFGLKPIYLVDYPVASQPAGYEPLRKWLRRGSCTVGAHLHPWTNPPFVEKISERNSFSGNLEAWLEEDKMTELVSVISKNFEIKPLFFKAGRYGLGPHTLDTASKLGFKVDFSVLPRTDLRADGGPDFRAADAIPYFAGTHRILSLPMTRYQVGAVTPLPPTLNGLLYSCTAKKLRISGVAARLRLANLVTLTPEGVTAEEQIWLIRSMLKRGRKLFVLHYHSPSLVPGNTPYVKDDRELNCFLDRLKSVCCYFFETVGGLPGNPDDLVDFTGWLEGRPPSSADMRPARQEVAAE